MGKLGPALWDTGLSRGSGRGPATPAKTLRTGPKHRALPKSPGSRSSPSLRRHSRPHPVRRPGPLRAPGPGPAHCSRILPGAAGLLRLRPRSRALRPSFPPSLPAPPLAARPAQCPLLPRCIAGAAAAECARAASEARAQGREGLGHGSGDPTAPRGQESPVGPGVGVSAGEYTPPVRLCLVARIPEEASWGRELPSSAYRSLPSSGPRLSPRTPPPRAGLPESGRGSRRGRREGRCPTRTSPAAPGPRGRAPPAPSSRAPRRPARRRATPGAVPAQSPRPAAPRPTPASAQHPVTSRPRIGARAGPRPVSSPPRPAIGPGGALGLWRGDGGTRSRVFAAAVRGAGRVAPGCGWVRAGRGRAAGRGRPSGEAPALRAAAVLPSPVSARRRESRPPARAIEGGGRRGRAGRAGAGPGARAPPPGRGEHACSRWGARVFTLRERV